MKILQQNYSTTNGWATHRDDGAVPNQCQLVLVFASVQTLCNDKLFASVKERFPKAAILLTSTAGQINGVQVQSETITLTAVEFSHTTLKTAVAHINQTDDSFQAGVTLAAALEKQGLTSLLVISDGLKVNGSELILGLRRDLPEGVIISGGLAGDDACFIRTVVGLNEVPCEGRIAVIGFYGSRLFIKCSSEGGWDAFGPERLITRSKGNVLYELDGKPALDIYKKYLGEYAADLPRSGLLFPLSIRTNTVHQSVVRTILAVNERKRSLTFAGNIPEGFYARMMKANPDNLIEAAATAASQLMVDGAPPQLALIISCVGRKLVLDQRIEEEVEMVGESLGSATALTGFYSYGEIATNVCTGKTELHNQTITITSFFEY